MQHVERTSLLNITCKISPVSPLPLTKVVLSAPTSEGYEFASSNSTLFKAWLFAKKPILRNGFTYRLMLPHDDSDTGGVFHEYTVVFSEPVAQGYALSATTEISVSLHRNKKPDQHVLGKVEVVHEDEECIEIDQNFLANSVLPSIGCVPHFYLLMQTYTTALFLDSIPASHNNMFKLVDGAHDSVCLPNGYTVLLKPSDLSKVGLISGDWVYRCRRRRIKRLIVS